MYNPQLETFIRVADAGSFNKAAEQAYITPTAVLKQINLLEADLGVQLFERTHRGLSLTKAGSSLYKDTKYIIQYCKDSVVRAKNAMQENADIIRIGTSPMTPAQVLVELWPQIHALCPEIKFQLVPFENTPENAREIFLEAIKVAIFAYMESVEVDDYYGDYDIDGLLKENMRYNGYYEELDTESVIDIVCDWIKEDVEQEVSEMIKKLPQFILNNIVISKNDVNIKKLDVKEYIESYLEPSEPEYDHHKRDYDYGIACEMDVLDCIFK